MKTNVWIESGGKLMRETLCQEARRWHQIHQPPTTLEEWITYRSRLLDKLRSLAGSFPEPVPLEIRECGELRMDGYTIRKLTYQSRENFRVTANLFVPEGRGPFPAVLNVHGHYSEGKIAAPVAARGHLLAKEGFVVLSVDAFGAGERGTRPGEFEYHGKQLGMSLTSIGETLLGMQVYDNMRGIDLLQSLDFVDSERIGVTGASGGGNQTMWVAAFDNRVKAAVPVVSVGTFESYVGNPNCVCEVLPEGLVNTEEWAVLALIAPNALLLVNSMQDGPTFIVNEMIRSFNAAREIYRHYGAEEKIAYAAIDLPHGYLPEMQRHMLGWFKRWLKNEGCGWPCSVPEIPQLPERELMCFPDGKRPAEVKTILEYVAEKSSQQKGRLLSSASREDAENKRHELARLLKLRHSEKHVSCGPAVRGKDNGRTFAKFTIESEAGVLLPCVHFLPPQSPVRRTIIAAHVEGKAALYNTGWIDERLGNGVSVCLVDLRHTGESDWDRVMGSIHHDASRSSLWLGRTMIGDWVTDLLAVRSALKDETPDISVQLYAVGEVALAAVAAAALFPYFAEVSVEDILSTYVLTDAVPGVRMSAYIPHILSWGDVSSMTALCQCPVTLLSAVAPSGAPLDGEEIAAFKREIQSLASAFRNELSVSVSG